MTAHQHEHEVWQQLDRIQMDVRQLSARLVELRSQVAQLNLRPPDELECPHCRLRFKRQTKLDEHIYISHDGPLPAHYKTAEQAADLDD